MIFGRATGGGSKAPPPPRPCFSVCLGVLFLTKKDAKSTDTPLHSQSVYAYLKWQSPPSPPFGRSNSRRVLGRLVTFVKEEDEELGASIASSVSNNCVEEAARASGVVVHLSFFPCPHSHAQPEPQRLRYVQMVLGCLACRARLIAPRSLGALHRGRSRNMAGRTCVAHADRLGFRPPRTQA